MHRRVGTLARSICICMFRVSVYLSIGARLFKAHWFPSNGVVQPMQSTVHNVRVCTTHVFARTYIHTYLCVIRTCMCNVCVYIYIYIHTYIHTLIHVYICIYIYTYIHTCYISCIYIYIERERDRERCMHLSIYLSLYVSMYPCAHARLVPTSADVPRTANDYTKRRANISIIRQL